MGLGYALCHAVCNRTPLATFQRQDDSPRLGRSIMERMWGTSGTPQQGMARRRIDAAALAIEYDEAH